MPVWLLLLLLIPVLIIAIVLLLLYSRVTLVISYKTHLHVYARYFLFKRDLVPYKEKKKKTVKNSAPDSQENGNEDGPIDTVIKIKDTIVDFAKTYIEKLHFKFTRLRIKVASENAAKTALLYGATTQGVTYLIETLENISNVDISTSSDISVYSDFLSQKSEIDCKIVLYVKTIDFIKRYIETRK